MDPEKFKKKTKKVAGTTDVDILMVEYLNPKYEIEVFSNKRTTPTGLLEVARLKPKKAELPRFIFRWDENTDDLDVDIYKEGRHRNDLWKIPDYKGHHTKKIKNRRFKANIEIPKEKVFRGVIDVGLFIKILKRESVQITERITYKIQKGKLVRK